MLNSFPVAVTVATALGYLAGLGVGGGSLLVLWLTLIADVPLPNARIINLLFFIPSALISSIFRLKKGVLDLKTVLPAIITGLASAALFSVLARYVQTDHIKKLFGILLLLTGLRELFAKHS